MNIKIFASGSKGNAYLIENKYDKILIDPGIPYKDLLKMMEFKISTVNHVLVSHDHNDHCRAVNDLIKNGVPVSMSGGCATSLGISEQVTHLLEYEKRYPIGNVDIMPFQTIHDANEPMGFLIRFGDKKVCYAVDTAYIKYQFNGVTHWMVECNYEDKLLEENKSLPLIVKNRIRMNHFELNHVRDFFNSQDLSYTEKIYLLHMSDRHSDAERFKAEIGNTTKKTVCYET